MQKAYGQNHWPERFGFIGVFLWLETHYCKWVDKANMQNCFVGSQYNAESRVPLLIPSTDSYCLPTILPVQSLSNMLFYMKSPAKWTMKQWDRQKWSKYKPCPQQQSDRLGTVCSSFTDAVMNTWLHQCDRRTLMNIFLTRSKEQNIKEINTLLLQGRKTPFFFLADPKSLCL